MPTLYTRIIYFFDKERLRREGFLRCSVVAHVYILLSPILLLQVREFEGGGGDVWKEEKLAFE